MIAMARWNGIMGLSGFADEGGRPIRTCQASLDPRTHGIKKHLACQAPSSRPERRASVPAILATLRPAAAKRTDSRANSTPA